ncbi:MAG: hypothetical protein GY849_02940, partial [Deltaproteobacteria bacterium]|nr:hypothetical protein [Deltaproteobacteria bacterium]
ALVVKDMSRMASVGLLVMEILGLDVDGARKLLFSSPTVLVGSISANTVNALKRRFQPLDVELDVSRPEEALFDIFLGDCPPSDRAKVENLLKKYRIPMVEDAGKEKLPVLALGLSKAQADQVWHRLLRYNLPVRVVNRDYQRYDMVLEESPASKDMIEFLTDTTGMPEEVALKVTQQTPIVTHQNIRFDEMTEYLEAITLLEGRASSHLLLFQTFSLVLEEMGDKETTSELLQAIGGLESGQAFEVMNKTHRVEGPLSKPRARWLQWELREVGTEAKMVLR